ncbi:DUF402 domain-containing protein [Microbacterium amylolyticum]|uniref:DUF402 domain-containing protein n=1 Tax=Microbacterium amylolyticum TaxID=936337 RepID=A0ABS4ZLP0_9MICO|nr:DUF402 domain-containing protein [Microbacterium amylolyticum]MBP2437371.1 hypothetical protein [Microbacterium amylolyticum]
MSTTSPPGTRMHINWRKWDGGPHWVHDVIYLGRDEWGAWFGQRAGWRSHRPGRDTLLKSDCVMLLPDPEPGSDHGAEWVLTVNAAPQRTRIYIDVAWEAQWVGAEPSAIDMDLDVVRRTDDRGIYIDDEDEWEEHRAEYGYPLHVVNRLEPLAQDLKRRVAARDAPFNEATTHTWFDVLYALKL